MEPAGKGQCPVYHANCIEDQNSFVAMWRSDSIAMNKARKTEIDVHVVTWKQRKGLDIFKMTW
jgi:hypothetical protein